MTHAVNVAIIRYYRVYVEDEECSMTDAEVEQKVREMISFNPVPTGQPKNRSVRRLSFPTRPSLPKMSANTPSSRKVKLQP